MTTAPTQPGNRLDRRKARTRAALIRAAQTLIAEGRTNVPILEITQAADVGMGSFYNHFETKEQLFDAAVEGGHGCLRPAHGPGHRGDRGSCRGVRRELPPHRKTASSRTRTEQGPAQQRACDCSVHPTDWPPGRVATSRPRARPVVSTSQTSMSR